MNITEIMKPITLQFDMSLEGVTNVWEAHGMICTNSQLECADIHNVEYITEINGWPVISVTFSNPECAQVYVAEYLGVSVTDSDVIDYMMCKK